MVSGEEICKETLLFLSDFTLAGPLEDSLQMIRILGSCGGASFKSQLSLLTFCYVMLVDTGESLKCEA